MFELCQSTNPEAIKGEAQNYICELKWDGTRCLAIKKGKDIKLFNRRGYALEHKYPELVEQLREVETDFEIDGEIVCLLNGKIGGDFNSLLRRETTQDKFKIKLLAKILPCTFVAFDLLDWKGSDYKGKPIEQRRELLHKIIAGTRISISCSFDDFESGWKFVLEHDCEGLVLKRKGSLYTPARSLDWLKCKNIKREVVEIEEMELSPDGCYVAYARNKTIKFAIGKKEIAEQLLASKLPKLVEIAFLDENEETGARRQPCFSRVVK